MAAVHSVFRKGLFEGKVAIVTGGGTGIGKSIASELLKLGTKVVIASRNAEKLQNTAEELNNCIEDCSSTATVKAIPCNIRDEEQVTDLIKSTISHFGKLDFLVNNGGGQFYSPASNISAKGWRAVIDTNLNGTFLCCKQAYNLWMNDHGGAIVNMLVDNWTGFPMMAHSGSARAGIHNLTMSLAVEWMHSKVRINNVAPGVIYSQSAAENYPDKNLFSRIAERLPYKRCGTPEEVSGAVCFLLSPAASYITGATIKIDGASSLVSYTDIPGYDGGFKSNL